MATYFVGSDHSGNGDMECINRVVEILNNNGHTATALGVTPNLEKDLSNGKGTIGVFIVNGICIGTFDSCCNMVKSGGCDRVIFAIPKVLYGGGLKLPDELKTKKIPIAHDDNFTPEPRRSELDGNYTVSEYCAENSQYVSYAYGDDCDQLAQSIMNGGEGGTAPSTESKGEGSIMSGWESITDLLKPLDGEAMVVVRGDAVIIKRIYPPSSTRLWVYEGFNIVADSVKVSDYSPEIYNTFVIHWGASFENSFEMCFEKHKELFGERKTDVDAVYEVPMDSETGDNVMDTSTETTTGDNSQSQEESTDDEDGGLFGFLGGFLGGDDKSKDVEDAKAQAESGITGEDEEQTKEIPITDEAEAYLFGLKQVGKARRKDGHQIECKVIGNKRFEVGEWCRVFIPSFNEDTIMFISKVSHDSGADSEWITSLTLVDYPPSLGSGQSNSPKSESDDGTATTDGSSLTDATGDGGLGDEGTVDASTLNSEEDK